MVEVDYIRQFGFLNPCSNMTAPGQIDAQWFLTIDCLACIDCGQDIVAVTIRRTGNIYHIDGRIIEYLIHVFGDNQVRPFSCGSCAGSLIRVPGGYDREAVMILHLSEKLPADSTKSNDSNLNLFHNTLSPAEYAAEVY